MSEKSCFTTSQTGRIKTKIESSKLFELTQASLNYRYIFLSYLLKSTERGQFAHAKAGLLHVSHIQHFSSHDVLYSRIEEHNLHCHATAASLTKIQRKREFPVSRYITSSHGGVTIQ